MDCVTILALIFLTRQKLSVQCPLPISNFAQSGLIMLLIKLVVPAYKKSSTFNSTTSKS